MEVRREERGNVGRYGYEGKVHGMRGGGREDDGSMGEMIRQGYS